MEIVDFVPSDAPVVEDPPFWEKRGKDLLWVSSLLATLGSLPLCFSKKPRSYVLLGFMSTSPSAPAVVESDPLPEALQCSPAARVIVEQLWTQIGEGSVSPALWFLGNQLENEHQLHPFPYLLTLPRDRVRQAFQKNDFVSSYVRIPAILGGIERGITKALSATKPAHWPNFWETLPLFAHHTHKDPTRIRQLVEAKAWRPLVEYLFDLTQ